MQRKCNTIHVCVHSWACSASELKLILVLKGDCIPLYLVKEPFGDSYKKTIFLGLLIVIEVRHMNFHKVPVLMCYITYTWSGSMAKRLRRWSVNCRVACSKSPRSVWPWLALCALEQGTSLYLHSASEGTLSRWPCEHVFLTLIQYSASAC